jgi:hypothetical protein
VGSFPGVHYPRFDQALQYAAAIHSEQIRNGTEIPYIAHLLGVGSIALEYGANEDEAIGALLHGRWRGCRGLERIETYVDAPAMRRAAKWRLQKTAETSTRDYSAGR